MKISESMWFNPGMKEIIHLENNRIFQINREKIERYIVLGLDFMVYGDGRINLLRNSKQNVSRKLRLRLLLDSGGECAICGEIGSKIKVHDGFEFIDSKGKKFQIDHIVPVCHGGNKELDNLQVLCQDCNRKKGCKYA